MLIPSLQKLVPVLRNLLHQAVDLVRWQAKAASQTGRVFKPDFSVTLLAIDMHMWWFGILTTEEEEPVTSPAQQCWHP
jgi:hypothetical protein